MSDDDSLPTFDDDIVPVQKVLEAAQQPVAENND